MHNLSQKLLPIVPKAYGTVFQLLIIMQLYVLLSTGEVKAELIALLVDIVGRHQKARAQVTEDIVDAFMAVRPMHSALKR